MQTERRFVKREGVVLGPYSHEEFERLVARGKIRASDLVSIDNATTWLPFQAPVAPEHITLAASPQEHEKAWYTMRDGEPVGPYVLSELRTSLSRGTLHLDDEICEVGQRRWMTVREVRELDDLLPPPAPTAGVAQPHSKATSHSHEAVASGEGLTRPSPRPAVAALANGARGEPEPPSSFPRKVILKALSVVILTVSVVSLLRQHLSTRSVRSNTNRPPISRVATDGGAPYADVADSDNGDRDAGRDTDTTNSPLPGGAPFWRGSDLTFVGETCPDDLWALFPGPAPGADEFAQRANGQQRSALATRLKSRTLAMLLTAEEFHLGDYDFQRHAFPVRIAENEIESCGSESLPSEERFAQATRIVDIAFAAPRLWAVPVSDGIRQGDIPTSAPAAYFRDEGLGQPYLWRAAQTYWIQVAQADAPAFRERHQGLLSVQVAFRITSGRIDQTRPVVVGRISENRLVRVLHLGAGRVALTRPIAVQINDGQEVLLDTAPRTRVSATESDGGVATEHAVQGVAHRYPHTSRAPNGTVLLTPF